LAEIPGWLVVELGKLCLDWKITVRREWKMLPSREAPENEEIMSGRSKL